MEPSPAARDVGIGLSCGTAHSSERTFFVLLLATQTKQAAAPHIFGMAKKADIWMDPWSFSVFDMKNLCKCPLQ